MLPLTVDMFIQVTTPCVYCGQAGTEQHHLLKRSVRPDLVDDPKNKVWLCNPCHARTETDNSFLVALQQIFWEWKPANVDLFTRAQATIEAIESGSLTDYTTPAMVDQYLQLATAKYAYVSEQLGQLEIAQAEYFTVNSDEELTNKELEMAWKITETGKRQVELSRKIKTLEKLMSTFKAKLRRLEMERWNLK